MVRFQSLDPETRAFALVGRFLQTWASMEWAIGTAIATPLQVNKMTEYILVRNLSFTNKINVLKCLCQISHLSDSDKKQTEDLLNAILGMVNYRNTIAHDLFKPSGKNDGVEFMTMRARGKISFPDADWSAAQFELMDIALAAAATRLDALSAKLKAARRISANALADLVSAIPDLPTEGFSGPGSLDHLAPQPPEPHPSATTPSTPETEIETPPSGQE